MLKSKIELVFLSLDVDSLVELQNQIGDSSNDFKFKYLADKIEHLDQLEQYDVVVSPANSFGELKGGIDYYYCKLLGGNKLQSYVYERVLKEQQGEIPIGQTLIIDLVKFSQIYNQTTNQQNEFNNYTGKPSQFYMCPTMTIPMNVDGTRNAYLFMKTLIRTLLDSNNKTIDENNRSKNLLDEKSNRIIKKVLVPLPAIGVGGMKPKAMAKQIKVAIQAYEGKGIIPAIFMTSQNEQSFREQKIYEYQPNNVLQNAKMACIQTAKP